MSHPQYNHFFTEHLKAATAEEADAPWLGGKHGRYFRCCFCGKKLVEGDKFRIIYTNDMSGGGGNPLTCEACNETTAQMRAKWYAKCQAMYSKENWWFNRP